MTGSCQNAIVPAYVYPASNGSSAPWSTLIGKTGGVYNSPLTSNLFRWVICEPDLSSGVTVADANYVSVIEDLHDTTQSPAGSLAGCYIDLDYGQVTEATVKAQIDKAVALYFGTSPGSKLYFDFIFFDRAPGTSGTYNPASGNPATYGQYLTDLINYATATDFGSGDDYWFNTGYWPDEAIMNLVSGVNTCFCVENSYSVWSTTDVGAAPAWLANYDGSRIASIVHDTGSSSDMLTGTGLANGINSETVFFTDNAYTTGLPSYWAAQYAQTNAGC